jgi:hypothetical protein
MVQQLDAPNTYISLTNSPGSNESQKLILIITVTETVLVEFRKIMDYVA